MAIDRTAFALHLAGTAHIPLLAGIVDGYVAAEHERSVSTTTYPVESGASLIDHAVRQPDKLTLEGWVSDLMPSADANQSRPSSERGLAAWEEIGRLMHARQPVTVTTSLGRSANMLIVKATAPVDRTTGRALRFTLELEELLVQPLIVEEGGLSIVPAPESPAADRPAEVDRGVVATVPYNVAQQQLASIR